MGTFKNDILEATNGEEIVGIVIGKFGWGGYKDKGTVPKKKIGKLLTWKQAAPMLDYEYSTGYGAPECHAVFVWTTESVLFVSQYDGSTAIYSIPRNPTPCEPDMPGG